MKRTLLFLIFAVTQMFGAVAQDFKIAPAVGIISTVSNLSRSSRDNYRETLDQEYNGGGKTHFWPHGGFQAGVLAEYSTDRAFGVQAGLLVSRKGWRFSTKGNTDGYNIRIKVKQSFTYLELPVMVFYKLGDNGFKILAGPVVSFAVAGKETMEAKVTGERDYNQTLKAEIGTDPDYDDLRPVDVSFNFALAKEIALWQQNLEISANVQPSLTKWNPSSKIDGRRFGRHFVVGIRAAYFLNIR